MPRPTTENRRQKLHVLTTRSILVTFLAFIFVPFSLATSVFGMNIQELNQEGQGIRAFIVTGVIIFVIFLLLYAVATAVNVAHINYKERSLLLGSELHKIKVQASFGLYERKHKGLTVKWRPSWYLALARRGLSLAFISKGRFDPKGYEYAHRDWDIRDPSEAEFKQPLPDRYWSEVKYFLGFHRLPREEDYETLWKMRDNADRPPVW